MNGRIYDPQLGRFLSADVKIQAAYVLQSYNRYSYAFNNPLRFPDYSGYNVPQEELNKMFPVVLGARDSLAEIDRKLTVNAELKRDYSSRTSMERYISRQIDLHENLNEFNNAGASDAASDEALKATAFAEAKFSGKVMLATYAITKLLINIIDPILDDEINPYEAPTDGNEQSDDSGRYQDYWEQDYSNSEENTRQRDYTAPGTPSITDQKKSSESDEVYERETIYDVFGRRIGNNDYTDHGRPGDHENPHHHENPPVGPGNQGEHGPPLPGLHPETPPPPPPEQTDPWWKFW